MEPSNCGKTNVIINLIDHKNVVKSENVYLYSKSFHQPKYIYIEKFLKPIRDIKFFKLTAREDRVETIKLIIFT